MPQMNLSQARVIDPILTKIAQGYRNSDLIGDALFPNVSVSQRGGKIISFGKEDFQLYNTGRTPGSNTKRVNFGYSSGSYVLEQHSLEAAVPFEMQQEASEVANINYQSMAVRKVQNIISLRTESAQAVLATTAGNYASSNKATLSGTSQWSDFGSTSDPISDIEAAKEAVRSKIGLRPNTVVLGAAVMAKLKQHPKIVDRIKYTGRDVATTELLASLFGVQRVLVGDAVTADDAGTFSDVWGKFVVVAYTQLGSLADMGLPSYGYTYRLDGAPYVETGYEDRNAKSDFYPVTDEVSPVIASALAGFLYSAVVA